jgi:acid phosphatase type 7
VRNNRAAPVLQRKHHSCALVCRFQFEHGPVHFVVYSTEHRFHVGSPQHAWMRAALAAVDRRRTPWLVVAGHRPVYVDSTNRDEPDGDQVIADELKVAFEKLWREYAVDLTLHGHHHSYQRTCPVYKGKCKGHDKHGTPKAPIHLVIGNAGKGLSHNIEEHQPKVRHLWRMRRG